MGALLIVLAVLLGQALARGFVIWRFRGQSDRLRRSMAKSGEKVLIPAERAVPGLDAPFRRCPDDGGDGAW